MQYQSILRKAKKLGRAGQYAEASAVLSGYVLKNPRNAAVRMALADSLVAQSDNGAALQILAGGLVEHPSNENFQARFVSLIRSAVIELPDALPAGERRKFVDLVGGAMDRALIEKWVSAKDLAKPAGYLVLADPDVGALPEPGEFGSLTADEASGFLASPAVRAYTRNRLFNSVMVHALVIRPELELALASIRKCALRLVSENTASREPDLVSFLCNLALDAFQSEYAIPLEAAEERAAAALAEEVRAELGAYVTRPNMVLPVLGAYLPLRGLFEESAPALEVHPVFETLWREQVLEPQRELEISAAIPVIGEVTDGVSLGVRRQYEENPYPRWRHLAVESSPLLLRDFLHRQFPGLARDALPDSGKIEVLVAGCGTGANPISTAAQFLDAEITALDLSLTSLAHAARKTEELGLSNIRYVQGDLLQCAGLGRQFDLIESMGVLHHLEKPALGIDKLTEVLKPGGFMRLALYSKTARSYVRAGQAFVKEQGFATDIEGIRQCRAALIASRGETEAARIVKDYDFYCASGCRDLLMHVQEHQYEFGELRRLIEESGLILVGFANLPWQLRQAYEKQFPQDKDLSSWDNLEVFEAANPDSFAGMYQFWCRKKN